MKKPIIFCDFDGTVTNNDNIIAIMKRFAPPEWEAIKDDILAERISIQQGVGRMFSLLPADRKEAITKYILQTAVVRDGFSEFVSYTRNNSIPLYIISGGIDFFVYPLLEGLVDQEHIFCNGSDFSGKEIRILWPHTCDEHCNNQCGCCKPSLLRKLAGEEDYTIVIGDSITDLQAAKLAHHVLARDFLLQKCIEQGIPHTPFTTFFDVIGFLESLEVKA